MQLSLLWTKGKVQQLVQQGREPRPQLLPPLPTPYLITGLARHQRGTIGTDSSLFTARGCAGHHDVGRDACWDSESCGGGGGICTLQKGNGVWAVLCLREGEPSCCSAGLGAVRGAACSCAAVCPRGHVFYLMLCSLTSPPHMLPSSRAAQASACPWFPLLCVTMARGRSCPALSASSTRLLTAFSAPRICNETRGWAPHPSPGTPARHRPVTP